MEKLTFGDSTYIYKGKLNVSEDKDELLVICDEIIKGLPKNTTDGFGYKMITNNLDFLGNIEIKNKLDNVIQTCINKCIELYKSTNTEFNIVETDGWVNVVRAKNPVQENFKEGKEKYHVHSEINKMNNAFIPTFTYVYYIQMPDNLKNDDGVLFIKDENGIEYSILPQEDDIIIMPGDLPHAPNKAEDSTKDRVVFAGNVGFKYIKKQKSLI